MTQPTGATTRPPTRRRLATRLLVWCALAAGIGHFGTNLVLRSMAAADGFQPGYEGALFVSWKTGVLLALSIVAPAFARRLLRGAPALGLRRPVAALLLASLGAVSVAGVVALDYCGSLSWAGMNRWGFWRVWPPGIETRFDPHNGEVDAIEAAFNAESYRDDEWTIPAPDDGTTRVVLVGDSVVASLSIERTVDQLDKQLERRLNEGALGSWDVWNVANAPASLWYFCEAIQRVAPDARARYAVQVVYCPVDLTFHDEQIALADKPPWFPRLARGVGLSDDLLWMAHNPWPYEYRPGDPALEAAHRARFERLLGFVREQDMHLVVWQATTPCAILAPFRGRPEVTFLSWQEHVGLACGDQPEHCNFYLDPRFGHPSGHLTPLGMSHLADVLAPTLLELEAARRRSPPAAR